RRERRVDAAGRPGRVTPPQPPSPRPPRTALSHAGGMPARAAAHDAADDPRRGHHRRSVVSPRRRRRWDGGDQPQDRAGRGALQGEADSRCGRSGRRPAHDRGHVGRRHRHGGDQPPRRQHPARDALHGVVHERLGPRACRRASPALAERGGVHLRRPPAGPGRLWLMLPASPMLYYLEEMSTRLGIVTKRGICRNLRVHYSHAAAVALIIPVVLSNVITTGADLSGASAALQLLTGIAWEWWTIPLAALTASTLVFARYRTISRFLPLLP